METNKVIIKLLDQNNINALMRKGSRDDYISFSPSLGEVDYMLNELVREIWPWCTNPTNNNSKKICIGMHASVSTRSRKNSMGMHKSMKDRVPNE